ncbi:CRISPR-associated DxTHG motif protein [Paenibacillus psychroresistens]|uniref:CRISPR-associated DxTHG motif protein n=1 Tax=Paenibacillus psychroresistens TaxID=1778678 RepID=A0A6B8RUT6_9BACL|nr:CRISPR-associated DxTHG motif protein [Paenibacillus psychroresistens]
MGSHSFRYMPILCPKDSKRLSDFRYRLRSG